MTLLLGCYLMVIIMLLKVFALLQNG
uniref:Uncharacterized protein n=1 Tax=Rhizophora mucronata TaxID=61149 RepID=A0A2P2NP73_RHIMU